MINMKGGIPHKLRARKLSFTLTGLICLTVALWAWEKTPPLNTFLPPSEDIFMSSVISANTFPETHKERSNQKPAAEVISDPSNVEIQSDPFTTTMKSGKGGITSVRGGEKSSFKGTKSASNSEEIQSDPSTVTMKSGKEGITSMRGRERSSSKGTQCAKNSGRATSGRKECNYAKGKWVADSRRPLYSGFGCKKWLSEMWSCRLNHREDVAYENYRWQPKDCEMPEFEGSKFLRRMRHKTIAFVGDSLGRQQFQSMMCMVTGGKEYTEVEDIGSQYGLGTAPGAKRPDGWAFRFTRTNTTILYYWSAILCDLEPISKTDPATMFAMHLDQPAAFLKQNLHRFDVLVLNTGHHWNRGKVNANRWVMYANGMPVTDKRAARIGNAKNLTIHSVAKWVDSQLPKHPRLKVFFRTISPRHFLNGDWDTGGSCDNTTPLAGGSEVTQEVSADPVIEDAVKGTRVKLLDITALSQLRDESHVSKYSIRTQPGSYDCLHWCLPGVPDTWNELVAAQV